MEDDSDSLFTINEEEESASRLQPESQTSYFILGSHKVRFLPSVNFIYQRLNFRDRCGQVPHFVKSNVQKTARLSSESFILKVNYLRRRREASTDVNKNRLLEEESRRQKFYDQSPRRSGSSASHA